MEPLYEQDIDFSLRIDGISEALEFFDLVYLNMNSNLRKIVCSWITD